MLRALIVEDEPPARRYLGELLAGTRRVELVAAVGTIAEADQALAAELAIDAAFVDIRLVDRPGDASGLHWARRVAAQPGAPQLVLATALAEHALAGFEAGAVDYLLKPLTRQRVAACVDRLIARRPARAAAAPSRLVARTAQSLVFLPIDGVLAFEAADRLAYVHHVDGRYLVDLSLAALEQRFADVVLRTHRNWLVVLDRVRELGRASGELVLQVGELAVPVSRDRAPGVREALVSRALGARR
ncbi:MAG TPA: LytTR family DNA-binding domain-containing protein [Kofleriaceae bacterium]|nr:LytTR family DNA-binding domain-containing protein [Kofleriaceae bacterium]